MLRFTEVLNKPDVDDIRDNGHMFDSLLKDDGREVEFWDFENKVYALLYRVGDQSRRRLVNIVNM